MSVAFVCGKDLCPPGEGNAVCVRFVCLVLFSLTGATLYRLVGIHMSHFPVTGSAVGLPACAGQEPVPETCPGSGALPPAARPWSQSQTDQRHVCSLVAECDVLICSVGVCGGPHGACG